MKIFDASEVFQFAIRIEENGERFYRYAEGIAKEEEEKKIFSYLADEETKHKKEFEDLDKKRNMSRRKAIQVNILRIFAPMQIALFLLKNSWMQNYPT